MVGSHVGWLCYKLQYKGFNKTTWSLQRDPLVLTQRRTHKREDVSAEWFQRKIESYGQTTFYILVSWWFLLVWKSIFQCSTSSVLDCNLTVYSLYLIRCFGRSFLLSIRGTISSKSSWVTGHYTMPPCYAMFLYFFDLILHAAKFSNKKTLETKACPSCKKAAPPLASNMLHWMMVSGQEKIQGMKLKLGTSGSLDLPCVYDASHPTKLLAARKFYVIQVIYMVG